MEERAAIVRRYVARPRDIVARAVFLTRQIVFQGSDANL